MIQIRDIADALERFAPLPLQEGYDNAGLQIGLTETEVSGALLCLDVTEAVIDEAVTLGCNLIVSHHPLLFSPLKRISDTTYVERCVMKAIKAGISIYSAHTNLDNVAGGVCYKMAEKLGLRDLEWLDGKDELSGSGLTGILPQEMSEDDFCQLVKHVFAVPCLRCNGLLGRKIRKIALCGGAGAFLIPQAVASGADVFLTGEIGYHRFFGYDGQILLLEAGHYESEQYTVGLLADFLGKEFPQMRIVTTKLVTNPIRYI